MSPRRTVVLAVVFAALAVYFFVFESVSVEAPEPEWTRAQKIVDCQEAEPSRIVVSAAGGTRLEARRRGGGWVIESTPGAPRQAEIAVEDLAGALCTLPVVETIADTGTLDAFGLDEPVAEVRLRLGTRETALLVGGFTPARNFLYLQRSGENDVLKVGALVRSELDKVLTHTHPPDDRERTADER